MNKKEKAKLFIQNFVIYGVGNIVSKIIPLIMVPIIAGMMPSPSAFGISDMTNTIVSFCSAFALMGMYDAMYRLFFDNEEKGHQSIVCITTLKFTACSSVIVAIVAILFRTQIALYFLGDVKYEYIVWIMAMSIFVGGTNSIVAAPTRMQNKRFLYLTANILSPLISYTISICLLLKGHYIIALPLANCIAACLIELYFLILNRKWFSVKRIDVNVLKELLLIGLPTMPSILLYWVFSSCDRIMIVNYLGINDAGIYAVGAKLGLASQLIYMAFASGWQYYAFVTMKEKSQVKDNSLIFEYLGCVSIIGFGVICAVSELVYRILFPEEYWTAFIVSPYLFLAPLVQMLFQVIGNQFLIIKKTWPCALFLTIGAAANVGLNILLIPLMGIEGAAISTLTGYVITVVVCAIVLSRMKLFIMSKRFQIVVIMGVLLMMAWRFVWMHQPVYMLLMTMAVTAVVVCLYKRDVLSFVKEGSKG